MVSISGSEMVEIPKYHDSIFTIAPGGVGGGVLKEWANLAGAVLHDTVTYHRKLFPTLLETQNVVKYKSWQTSAAMLQRNLQINKQMELPADISYGQSKE